MGLMDKMMERMIKNMSVEEKEAMMLKMMPMGVSVYETTTGQVEIATWNMGMMADMFPGTTGEVLREGAGNLANTLEGIVE